MIGASDLSSVPFTYRAWGADQVSYHQVDGRLRLEGDRLVVEWHAVLMRYDQATGEKYDQVGEARGELSLSLLELQTLTLRRGILWGLFGGSLSLEAMRLGALAELPGARAGRITLGLARRDLSAAHALVSRALLMRSELRLAQLDEPSAHLTDPTLEHEAPTQRPKTLLS